MQDFDDNATSSTGSFVRSQLTPRGTKNERCTRHCGKKNPFTKKQQRL